MLQRQRDRMRSACAAWRDCPHRRAVNEAGAASDRVGALLMALLFPLLLVAKTWLREGRPGLALLASTHAVLAAAMAFLAGHRGCGRRFYVQHREALTLLYCLHMQWTVRLTACESTVNTIDHHGGSPLALLLLLLGHTTALYCAIVVLYARLLLPASAAVLAAASAASLLSGPRMCLRVLEAEAVEAPLEQLHGLVGLSLGLALPPGVTSLVGQLAPSPMQRCLALNAFLVVTVGAAVPFLLLRGLQRARKGRAARRAEDDDEDDCEREERRSPDSTARRLVLGYFMLGATWAVACSLASGSA